MHPTSADTLPGVADERASARRQRNVSGLRSASARHIPYQPREEPS
jgi:hypothetical protein